MLEKIKNIRKATLNDLPRISEIEIFNYRLNFYPIFKNDKFYFEELQVITQTEKYKNDLDNIFVYDDGVVKGFIMLYGSEVKKLFVEPVLQCQSIGSNLLNYAIAEMNVNFLWVLEKNTRAIDFYMRHGFCITNERKPEDDTGEYLVRFKR